MLTFLIVLLEAFARPPPHTPTNTQAHSRRHSSKSVEVINADEDLRVTDGEGDGGAVTGIGDVRMDVVL